MNTSNIAFARELALSGLLHLESVSNVAQLLLHEKPRKDNMLINLALRRAWIDSNKKISIAWKRSTKHYAPQKPISFPGATQLNDSFIHALYTEIPYALSSLKTDGYYKFATRVPNIRLQAIADRLHNDLLIPELPSQRRTQHLSIPREQCIHDSALLRFFYSDNLLNSKEVLYLFNSSPLLELSRRFLDCPEPILKTSGWLSVGRINPTQKELSDAAQAYHFDFDGFNFIKFFIYLSDVDEASGAHQFIRGSHKPFNISRTDLYSMPAYYRASRDQLSSLYSNDSDYIAHYGTAGTIIAEDTSGFHCGAPLAALATRDILMLEYIDTDLAKLVHGTSCE